MISNRKAAYVLQEIKNIAFYNDLISEHHKELREIEKQKETFASPKSPQGHENIGAGNQHNAGDGKERLYDLLEKQDAIEYRIQLLSDRLTFAENYKQDILESDSRQFIIDYLNGTKIKDLEKTYGVSNAYDKMIRIIKNNIFDIGV